jgi:hypothetical protein
MRSQHRRRFLGVARSPFQRALAVAVSLAVRAAASSPSVDGQLRAVGGRSAKLKHCAVACCHSFAATRPSHGRPRPACTYPALPGAGSVTRTHYEINLDQRILDPEICMRMAARPAGRR